MLPNMRSIDEGLDNLVFEMADLDRFPTATQLGLERAGKALRRAVDGGYHVCVDRRQCRPSAVNAPHPCGTAHTLLQAVRAEWTRRAARQRASGSSTAAAGRAPASPDSSRTG